MEITFVGVGEAFDELNTNTSVLVQTNVDGENRQILLDCGFTAAHSFWRLSPDPMALDAVWLSHFHGDHYFGLPLLLLRFREQNRYKVLTIIGQPGVEETVETLMDMAYPGFFQTIEYEIEFIEAWPGKDIWCSGIPWNFAENDHSAPAFSARLNAQDGSVFYSGDGKYTSRTRDLAGECDLIIHEAYGMEEIKPDHASVKGCMDFAGTAGAKYLALVHVQRDVRREKAQEIRELLSTAQTFEGILPESGDTLKI